MTAGCATEPLSIIVGMYLKSAFVIAPKWNNHHYPISPCGVALSWTGSPVSSPLPLLRLFDLLRQGFAKNERLGVETSSKKWWNGVEIKFRSLKKHGDTAIYANKSFKIPPVTAVDTNERGTHPHTHTPPNVQEKLPLMIECATANNPGPNHFFIS